MVISVQEQWLMLAMSFVVWMIFTRLLYRIFSGGTPLKHSLLVALMFGALGVPVFWLLIYLKFVVHEHGFILPEFK